MEGYLTKIKLIHIPKLGFDFRQNSIMVGMAEYRIAYNPTNLSTWALGSCVAIILFDPSKKIGGLAHCMLPEPHGGVVDSAGKYVATAIPSMVKSLKKFGVQEKMLRAAIVGGASVLRMSLTSNDTLSGIGLRNVRKAKDILHSLGIPIDVDETGGDKGRNLLFKLVTGEVLVAYVRKPDWL